MKLLSVIFFEFSSSATSVKRSDLLFSCSLINQLKYTEVQSKWNTWSLPIRIEGLHDWFLPLRVGIITHNNYFELYNASLTSCFTLSLTWSSWNMHTAQVMLICQQRMVTTAEKPVMEMKKFEKWWKWPDIDNLWQKVSSYRHSSYRPVFLTFYHGCH